MFHYSLFSSYEIHTSVFAALGNTVAGTEGEALWKSRRKTVCGSLCGGRRGVRQAQLRDPPTSHL